jgi:hypothetical protein
MRCLTLAEGWIASGGTASIWGVVSLAFVESRARAVGVHLGAQVPTDVDVLVVDTYDSRTRESLAHFQAKVRVLVDDMGEGIPDGYHAVWNPNPYSSGEMYPGFHGETLVGVSFVPVRAGLPQWDPADFVGVALGGSASSPAVSEMLDVLTGLLQGKPVRALGSALRPGWTAIAPERPWLELRLARVLICSASSSLWEAANVGVPTVIVAFADNHSLVVEWAKRQGMPVVDLLKEPPRAAAHRVFEALRQAPAVPRIVSGTGNVVGRLHQLAAAR